MLFNNPTCCFTLTIYSLFILYSSFIAQITKQNTDKHLIVSILITCDLVTWFNPLLLTLGQKQSDTFREIFQAKISLGKHS